ncbi:MAG: pyridoxal phosphate enzyme YggS family [Verrucomicrobiales bacterium]|nr:pyridoxal phosphate enzyme YggS family [Verrucomicrobiales bacterium]MDB6131230.1 pyridoxal phosphate enzyme YggS family [Verrucomicrobiales bacterium]
MDIEANLAAIRSRIDAACERAGRNPSEVTLMAVSKGQSASTVEGALAAGLTLFGENRVQEAKIKISQCSNRCRWQLIGHLQSNKCRDAVHFFEKIQSVDSLDLARELNKFADKSAKNLPILLEVNMAKEASKFGYDPELLLQELEDLNRLTKIEIMGLMTVAPWSPEPEKVRPIFRQMKELLDQCSAKLGAPLTELSMGMSGDFEVAIEEGATLVRIGTALFGARPLPPKN